MATVDITKLQLIPDEEDQEVRAQPRAQNGREKKTGNKQPPLQYDPHLREEWHRFKANQVPTMAIARQKDGKRYVDVIARLEKPADPKALPPIPLEIQNPKRISDLFVTGTVDVEKVEAVRREVGKDGSLKAATELYLDLYNSVSAIDCDPKSLESVRGPNGESFPGLDGSGVIIGIVDFGCDFRHRNFRYASGATRIRYLWDQSGEQTDLSPGEYGYGREFNADLINQALQDEDRAYERLRYAPAVAAHGTHVMDIAAGNGREPADFGGQPGPVPGELSHPGVAPNAQLIFVHLKTFDQSPLGFLGNSRYLLEAVDYIFRRADALNMPAVVNLSLSSSGGPHDGTTLVEQGMAALVNARPGRAIVVSAGNGYTKESHVRGTVRKGAPATILWHTDRRHADPETTRNEMEVWYTGGKTLQVALYAPGSAQPVGTVNLRETKELYEGEKRLGRISHRENDPNNQDNQIDIRLPHLENVPGTWKIELSTEEREVEFHAWIEQDDLGLARFEGADPNYTIGSISCNDAMLVVGAFDTAEMACLAPPLGASSAGPTRPTRRGKEASRPRPDLSAPGVNIVAARARGGVTVMAGTSMAAPHVTGLVALLFQLALRSGKGLLPFSTIRGMLDHLVDPPSSGEPASQLGAGRVNGTRAAASVLKLAASSIGVDFAPAEPAARRQPGARPQALGNGRHKDLQAFTRLLQQQLASNGHNGSHDLDSLIEFMEDQIQKGEGFRLRVEPLS